MAALALEIGEGEEEEEGEALTAATKYPAIVVRQVPVPGREMYR
jgi:hypothetical protein